MLTERFVAGYYAIEGMMSRRDSCGLYVAWRQPIRDHISLVFPKRSKYLEIMSYQLLKLREGGILKVIGCVLAHWHPASTVTAL